jgi:hypothetical protein
VVGGAPLQAGAGGVDVDVDPIAAAEARTRAYEERMKGVSLTWHKELTSFDPALPVAPAPPTPTPAPAPKTPLAEAPSSSPIVDKAVVAAPAAEPGVVARAAADDHDDDDDDEAAAAADDDEEDAARDPRRLDEAISRVLGEQKKAQTEALPTTPEKRYALQLASPATEAAAQVLADGWVQRGQQAAVVAAEVAGKGTMYRVRIGGIASRAAADALKARLGQGLVVSE